MDENMQAGTPQGSPAPEHEAPKQEQQPGTGQGSAKAEVKGATDKLEALLEEYMVKKAPFTLPMSVKEILVKIAPYIVIIGAIMALPVIIAALGINAFLAPFAMMGGSYYWGTAGIISAIFAAIAFVIEIMAVPGLFKRTHKGWQLAYYASLVMLVGNIVSFNIVSGIIGAIIGWYFLFQVKELYKN
ncbi:MAG: hypothetical protein A2808_03770 [Candidatus Moranbacteria bacterium RIFCSPHIGHO2_01_FULL_55_24]|nr:MAG: hypothetical protein A2808_03770 [Candidatus Moranbacteria bacterium RIFCSPHIGHO2_01_FULL_55_24]